MPQYTVVLRASSAVQFQWDESVRVNGVQTPFGPATVAFSTHWAKLPSADLPVPLGVHAEVIGSAPEMNTALRTFSALADGLMPSMTLVANATTESLTPDLAYASDDDLAEREFFQHYSSNTEVLPLQRRTVNPDHITAVLLAVAAHPNGDRLHRALALYHFALQHWTPGDDIVAAHALWVGIECMTPIVADAHLAAQGMNPKELMRVWGIKTKKLLPAQVRRRLIFKNDTLYEQARDMADGYEHSFAHIPTVRTAAVAARGGLATVLRSTIITQLALSTEVKAALLASSAVLDLTIRRFLRCILVGPEALPVESLGEDGQLYPRFEWHTQYRQVVGDDSTVSLDFKDLTRPVFAPGVEVKRGSARITLLAGDERVTVPIADADNEVRQP